MIAMSSQGNRKQYPFWAPFVCLVWGHNRFASLGSGCQYCRRCGTVHPPFGEPGLRSWMVGTRLLMLRVRFRMWREKRRQSE